MRFPANLRYSKEHLWVRLENQIIMIGLTEYAQYELGSISGVSVIDTKNLILKGEVFGTIDAIKMEWDMYLPLSGSIVEVNPLVMTNPGLLNSDIYGQGWIIKLKPAHEEELKELMHASSYMGAW